MQRIRSLAETQNMSVSEWVRQTLRAAERRSPGSNAEKKIRSIRAAVRHAFPTADVAQMVAEIESGYGSA
jgi:hypothetical protein